MVMLGEKNGSKKKLEGQEIDSRNIAIQVKAEAQLAIVLPHDLFYAPLSLLPVDTKSVPVT